MTRPPKRPAETTAAAAPRRSYDSELRRQQAAQTRDSIVAAGALIAHNLASWDWSGVTFKAVAERAGISIRTVYRHFSSERQLRDAILQRLVQESGVSLDGLELGDFAGIAARVYQYLASFAADTAVAEEPSFAALDRFRREVLLGAVMRSTSGWPKADQEIAAAMLDMLWNPASYSRLTTAWHLDTQRATQAITWVIGLVEQAIKDGRRPGQRARK